MEPCPHILVPATFPPKDDRSKGCGTVCGNGSSLRDERLLIRFAHPGLKSWAGPAIPSMPGPLDAHSPIGSVFQTDPPGTSENTCAPCVDGTESPQCSPTRASTISRW